MSGLNGIVDTQISRHLAICISLRFFFPLFLVWWVGGVLTLHSFPDPHFASLGEQ